jgi:hypothetical protein
MELFFDSRPINIKVVESLGEVTLGAIIYRHNNCSFISSDPSVGGDFSSEDIL